MISPVSYSCFNFLYAKEDLAGQIKYALKRQRELNRAVPLIAFGDIKYCAFISNPGIIQYPIQEQLDYTYAAASRNEKISVMWISLEYDNKNRLVLAKGKKCFFSDLEGDDIECIRRMGQKKARDWVLQYKMTHGGIGRNDYCPCGSGKNTNSAVSKTNNSNRRGLMDNNLKFSNFRCSQSFDGYPLPNARRSAIIKLPII